MNQHAVGAGRDGSVCKNRFAAPQRPLYSAAEGGSQVWTGRVALLQIALAKGVRPAQVQQCHIGIVAGREASFVRDSKPLCGSGGNQRRDAIEGQLAMEM